MRMFTQTHLRQPRHRPRTHPRQNVIVDCSILLHQAAGDGDVGQFQTLRGELRGELPSLRVGGVQRA